MLDEDRPIAPHEQMSRLARHGFGGTDEEIARAATADTAMNRAFDAVFGPVEDTSEVAPPVDVRPPRHAALRRPFSAT